MFAAMFVWFASVVEKLADWLVGMSVFTVAVLLIWYFVGLISRSPEVENKVMFPHSTRGGKWLIALVLIFSFSSKMLPTEKTTYFMAGAYIGQNMIQSDIGDKLTRIVNKKLEAYLTELEGEVQQPKKAAQ